MSSLLKIQIVQDFMIIFSHGVFHSETGKPAEDIRKFLLTQQNCPWQPFVLDILYQVEYVPADH